MPNQTTVKEQLHLLSRFVLNPACSAEMLTYVSELHPYEFRTFVSLLDQHHVVLRALTPLQKIAAEAENSYVSERAQLAIECEHQRIRTALQSLKAICDELEAAGCPVVVFKTLEHWPDFGSDLDVFTTGDESLVHELLRQRFRARSKMRSCGDFLSHKRSFQLPDGKTPVEVHISRLGQAGEHVQLAKRIVNRRQSICVNGQSFYVPGVEERVIVTSLERMYRHLYFRLCDILNLGGLIRSSSLNYRQLQEVAEENGIWQRVAACLKIVSEYTNSYGGHAWQLPTQVETAARVDSEALFVRDGLWHLPVLPLGAQLFASEFAHTVRKGDFAASARLSLLPPLASLASLAYVVTGNSGRIW